MVHTLRLGIAGIGNEGHQVVPYCDQVEEADLAAVADVRPAALEAFRSERPEVQLFSSVEAMCASGRVDAI